MAVTRAPLPAPPAATDPLETPVNADPAAEHGPDELLDQAVRLLAERPGADDAELAHTAHRLHPQTTEQDWLAVIDGARSQLRDRATLAADHGLSTRTLQRLWTAREKNAHPPAVVIGGVMHWCAPQWRRWHEDLAAATAAEYKAKADVVNVCADDDPDELLPINALAKIMGHSDTSTVLGWRSNPPTGSIGDLLRGDPDGEVRHYGKVVPAYRRSRLQEAAEKAPARGRSGAGRGAGRKPKAHPWAGDPKLDLARRLLAEQPDASTADLVRAARQEDGTGTSEPTWRQIVETARTHPEAK
ncbi:hypothetical protein [Kitasatospora sp. NPDC059160]|uniref:hypothetical protein n=1 Tax=Kitasatospora sp. NPDC059160 TaxID=3346748 RepID=UPI0036A66F30